MKLAAQGSMKLGFPGWVSRSEEPCSASRSLPALSLCSHPHFSFLLHKRLSATWTAVLLRRFSLWFSHTVFSTWETFTFFFCLLENFSSPCKIQLKCQLFFAALIHCYGLHGFLSHWNPTLGAYDAAYHRLGAIWGWGVVTIWDLLLLLAAWGANHLDFLIVGEKKHCTSKWNK